MSLFRSLQARRGCAILGQTMSELAGAHYDVIVVGAGPAGTSCAICCARQGKRVLLLDRARFPRDKVCGDYLNTRCWDVFERLGVKEKLLALPHHEAPGFLFSTLDGCVIQVEFAPEILQKHRSVAIHRKTLDACLVDQARACGVEVWENATVAGIKRPKDWILEIHCADDEMRLPSPSADFLVGADGRHSFVGRHVGLLKAEAEDEHVGVQFLMRVGPSMSDCIQLHQLEDGYCGAVRIGEDLANICMAVSRKTAHKTDPQRLRVNPTLDKFLTGAEPVGKPRCITPILGGEFAPCGDGVLLVGDAARVIEPFTGQGVYFALRSGELAADAIVHDRVWRYERRLNAEYFAHGRTNRFMREILWRDWAVHGVAKLASWWPKSMEKIVASVVK